MGQCGCLWGNSEMFEIGQKVERLTIQSDPFLKRGERYILVSCQCSPDRHYPVKLSKLGTQTKSCGCLKRIYHNRLCHSAMPNSILYEEKSAT